MRYIRTEDGVYEVVDTYETKYVVGYTEDGFEISIYKEDVIKQADTIKELCDVYVIVGEDKDTNGNPILWSIRQDIPFFMKYYFNYNDIYAAIWTDKGLIYVAKMNEKGELELIWDT